MTNNGKLTLSGVDVTGNWLGVTRDSESDRVPRFESVDNSCELDVRLWLESRGGLAKILGGLEAANSRVRSQ